MISKELIAKRTEARKSGDKATFINSRKEVKSVLENILVKLITESILNVAIGEIELETSRRMPPKINEEQVVKIVRKLIDSNRETIARLEDGAAKDILIQEIDILESFLPQEWDENQIRRFIEDDSALLSSVADAKSDGEATGKAMKALKSIKAPVAGKTVAVAVKSIRA